MGRPGRNLAPDQLGQVLPVPPVKSRWVSGSHLTEAWDERVGGDRAVGAADQRVDVERVDVAAELAGEFGGR